MNEQEIKDAVLKCETLDDLRNVFLKVGAFSGTFGQPFTGDKMVRSIDKFKNEGLPMLLTRKFELRRRAMTIERWEQSQIDWWCKVP